MGGYPTRVILILALWVAMFPVFPGSLPAAGSDPGEYVRWRMTGQKRTRDNGVATSYELAGSRGDMKLSDVELIFISTRRAGAEGKITEAYAKNLTEAGGAYHVDIYSGRYERIALLAKARGGEKRFYARTLLNGYGESGKTDPEAARIEKIPDWPQLRLAGEEYFYRAQTGAPLNIHIENGPRAVRVFENNSPIGIQALADTGFYTYTPAHDKTLSRAGYSAKNDLAFVAELENGDAVSLYLPVYRAYYGQTSLGAGLGVAVASAIFCLGSVLWRGRKFRWN